MAKARLVDFRGGINQKISPHMIGDTQAQEAKNVDLSAVRLEGLTAPITDDLGISAGVFREAYGEQFLDTGDSVSQRWITTDPNHTGILSGPYSYPTFYVQYVSNSTDFVVWNKDLYVSRLNSSGSDTLLRFVNESSATSNGGNNTGYALAFEPPAQVLLESSYYETVGTYSLDNNRSLTYDEFRSTAFRSTAGGNTTATEASSPARGVNWAVNRNLNSLSDSGYYLRTVRNYRGLPIESNSSVKADLTNGSYIHSVNSTPNLLNFSITTPSDANDSFVSAMPVIGYRLYRNDNLSRNVSLGLISPETITLTINNNAYILNAYEFAFSGLDPNGTYRVKWWCHSGAKFSTSEANANSDSGDTAATNLNGATFTVNSGGQAFLGFRHNSTAGLSWDAIHRGVDLWIEREVLTDVWATVGCVSYWYGNNLSSTGTSSYTGSHSVVDFIDCFASGLSSGYITSNQDKTAPPNSLKFLAEWNNFFFGVGSEYTSSDRYGDNINKKDSFLFVSDYNNPRHWPLDGYVEFPDSITGIYPYRDAMIVFTRRAIYRVFGSRANQMRKVQVNTIEGLPPDYRKTIQMLGSYLIWVSTKGICLYDGNSVTNLTRGRFSSDIFDGYTPVDSVTFENKYYVITNNMSGYIIDFNLEGFPLIEVDDFSKGYATTKPVASTNLEYIPSKHQVYVNWYNTTAVGGFNSSSINSAIIEGYDVSSDPYSVLTSTFNPQKPWVYRTRSFDGGNFGAIKLVRNVTINGYGYGQVTIRIDGTTVVNQQTVGSYTSWGQKPEDATPITEPTRVYLPETVAGNPFGLPAGDVWDVELEWMGTVDWIETEYDLLSA